MYAKHFRADTLPDHKHKIIITTQQTMHTYLQTALNHSLSELNHSDLAVIAHT